MSCRCDLTSRASYDTQVQCNISTFFLTSPPVEMGISARHTSVTPYHREPTHRMQADPPLPARPTILHNNTSMSQAPRGRSFSGPPASEPLELSTISASPYVHCAPSQSKVRRDFPVSSLSKPSGGIRNRCRRLLQSCYGCFCVAQNAETDVDVVEEMHWTEA